MEKVNEKYYNMSLLKFIIPSLLGISLFIIPLKIEGKITIPIAFLANFIQGNFSDLLKVIALVLISLSVIGSIVIKLFKPKFLTENSYLNNLFNVTPLWFIARILGLIFVICAFFEIGPEFIWSSDTAGLVLNDLLPILIAVFFFAGFLLPLLLDFGLLEFVGSILTKFMRPLFNLPGRSSIDCIASWLGDGSVGILLTSKQYEQGFYTKREAAVIGTTFSAVSVTFCLVVISQ